MQKKKYDLNNTMNETVWQLCILCFHGINTLILQVKNPALSTNYQSQKLHVQQRCKLHSISLLLFTGVAFKGDVKIHRDPKDQFRKSSPTWTSELLSSSMYSCIFKKVEVLSCRITWQMEWNVLRLHDGYIENLYHTYTSIVLVLAWFPVNRQRHVLLNVVALNYWASAVLEDLPQLKMNTET